MERMGFFAAVPQVACWGKIAVPPYCQSCIQFLHPWSVSRSGVSIRTSPRPSRPTSTQLRQWTEAHAASKPVHPTTANTHTDTQTHRDIHTTLVQWAKLEKGACVRAAGLWWWCWWWGGGRGGVGLIRPRESGF